MREILDALGYDPQREGLRSTPTRVAKAWLELTEGERQDPQTILAKSFDVGTYDQVVLLKNIDFSSTCEHHMLPFHGMAHVAYLPGERVVGLSKLARLVECFARRLQVQERMTKQVAHALMEHTGARGVAVVVEGTHTCMCYRGVRKHDGACMVTSEMLGLFRENQTARSEVLHLMRR